MIQAKKRRKAINTVLTYVMLVLIAIVCAGPFIWLLAASFRSGQNIYDISLIPQNPTLENYIGCLLYTSRCV